MLRQSGSDCDFELWEKYTVTLAKLANLEVCEPHSERPKGMVFAPLRTGNGLAPVETVWGEVGIEPPEGFDSDKARSALQKKLDEVLVHLQRNQRRYENPEFRAKAGDATVSKIAEKIEQLKAQEKLLEAQIGLIQ